VQSSRSERSFKSTTKSTAFFSREEEGVAGRWRGWKSARQTEHLAVARTQAKLVSRSRRGLHPLSRTSKPSRVSAIQTKVWLDSVTPAAWLWLDPH